MILEKAIKILFETKSFDSVRRVVQKSFEQILCGRFGLHRFIFAKEYNGARWRDYFTMTSAKSLWNKEFNWLVLFILYFFRVCCAAYVEFEWYHDDIPGWKNLKSALGGFVYKQSLIYHHRAKIMAEKRFLVYRKNALVIYSILLTNIEFISFIICQSWSRVRSALASNAGCLRNYY